MLDFVNNYYELTDENKDALYQMMIAEDIRKYNGNKINLNDMQVGYIFGNIIDDNPKRTGYWPSRNGLYKNTLQKVTTKVPTVITIE